MQARNSSIYELDDASLSCEALALSCLVSLLLITFKQNSHFGVAQVLALVLAKREPAKRQPHSVLHSAGGDGCCTTTGCHLDGLISVRRMNVMFF